jgi:hypothetical protein
MADYGRSAEGGDTLEFLRVMSTPTPSAAAPADGAGAPTGGAGAPTGGLPRIDEVDDELKPVVIKGGPRRVVRLDGRMPEVGYAMGQRRFALSSGHALFAPNRKPPAWAVAAFAGVCLVAVVGVGALALHLTDDAIRLENQQAVVGTSSYDSYLSLTPANDGGYYTVFLVTSTTTDEDVIGELSQAFMYRTDKAVTSAMRITVPTNLYVAPTTSYPEARTLTQVLADQGIGKALGAVDDAFGTRLYNVVCCDEETFASLAGLLDGSVDASAVDPDSYLGEVRTNLELADLVAWCSQVGALDQASIARFVAPTTDLVVGDATLAEGSSQLFAEALQSAAFYEVVAYDESGNPVIAQKNADGTYYGTYYDENGNPLLDENGYPQGALWTDEGLYFDENGYLQFYGQQYDDRGYPLGTTYDADGNPVLDWAGNPVGTQYDENGNPVYDWRGNLVVATEG